MSGRFLRDYLSGRIKAPIFIAGNYLLPSWADKNTLLFAVSYSGNTEETLSLYRQARQAKIPRLVVTSGGLLREMAERDGSSCLVVPPGLPPRTALGYLTIGPLVWLERLNLIKGERQAIRDMIRDLTEEVKKYKPENTNNLAANLARKLKGSIPIIYGSSDLTAAVSYRWRTQLAENSKIIAFTHFFPELNHNEIEGWREKRGLYKKCVVIIIRDRDDLPANKKRMEITARLILRKTSLR